MKRLVGVSAFEFSTTFASWYYIANASDYHVKCKVVGENRGLFFDKYTLQLEGEADDIQMFLDYLKYEGFKIR